MRDIRDRSIQALLVMALLSTEAAGGGIRPCPSTPNCVSSRGEDQRHSIRPLRFEGRAEDALGMLEKAVLAEPRTVIVDRRDLYLRAESTSLIFRFVDDLEFEVVPGQMKVDVRSASRVGYWDLGVNRRRIERIRQRFDALMLSR